MSSELVCNQLEFDHEGIKTLTKRISATSEQAENSSQTQQDINTYDFTEHMKRDNQKEQQHHSSKKNRRLKVRSNTPGPTANALDESLDEFDE